MPKVVTDLNNVYHGLAGLEAAISEEVETLKKHIIKRATSDMVDGLTKILAQYGFRLQKARDEASLVNVIRLEVVIPEKINSNKGES